ncbi:MAG TPA: hypothetical protein VIM75_08495 [Ohtaekwangia sp.]|uniref:hypothetical protein n=1 Tax=Ohtaekwangia sp. TaxID=2066019 RepID=UPI002F93EF50
MRILVTLAIFIGGCASVPLKSTVSQINRDVLILSILIQDHLRQTEGRDITLTELLQADTLDRISKSFDKMELKSRGGYISVYYKFSASRDLKGIELSDKEKERTNSFRWTEKVLKNQYDGEIQFDYGERFYRVRKIIINRPAT